jgi:hypothetical protein
LHLAHRSSRPIHSDSSMILGFPLAQSLSYVA